MKISVNGKKIKLNPNEFLIFKEALAFHKLKLVEEESISSDEEVISFFRNVVIANYLSYIGFDKDYNITEKGRILESLIDKFN